MSRFLIASLIIVTSLSSCVPARKFEELKAKLEQCESEKSSVKADKKDLETENNELQASVELTQKKIEALKVDTTSLGKQYRQLENQYEKINDLNDELLRKYSDLKRGTESENKSLLSSLETLKGELQKKEDRLSNMEDDLNILKNALEDKELSLNQLSTDLQAREQKVAELQQMISRKDSAVNALRQKVAHALRGFENNGLTIEQKNGKIYVSMDAKLLFPSGSTTIDSKGKGALVELSKVLEAQQDIEVVVEGHTDTDKINGGKYKDNWDLSVIRATSVVRLMMENSNIDPTRLSAAGRGEYLPLDPNDKAKNRRIEIILVPNLDELYNLIEE